jgi:DNA-binding transcriptional ArsR family regulator
VFRAVADPTRRAILDLLAVSERSVQELTARFAISQPAISQHLRELREARLVTARRVRREQRYRLTAEPLRTVHDWTERYRRFFDVAGHMWTLVEDGSERKPTAEKAAVVHKTAGKRKT